MEANGK